MALRVGLIGCGGVARAHWSGFEVSRDRAELVALADVSTQNRAWFKKHVPQAGEYDDFNQMIQNEKLDAVDICLPHYLHHPCVMAAISKGLHWMCEKPLCLTLAEATEIERAMTGSKLIGMSAHNQAFYPALLEARRLITEGQLGDVYTIISEDCFIMGLPAPGTLPGTKPWTAVAAGSWRADLAKMGGGELIDTGYHPTYRLLLLAGAEPAQVAAVTGTYRNKHMQAEDTATVVIGFDNGVTGLIRTSWAMEKPFAHYPFHVVGARGELFGQPNELYFKPLRFGEPARMTFKEVNPFQAEVVHFIDCIEQNHQPLQSYADGIRVLRVILKSYEFVKANKGQV